MLSIPLVPFAKITQIGSYVAYALSGPLHGISSLASLHVSSVGSLRASRKFCRTGLSSCHRPRRLLLNTRSFPILSYLLYRNIGQISTLCDSNTVAAHITNVLINKTSE